MPSDRRSRSGSAGSNRSGHSRASGSMGADGGEAGRRMAAAEEEFIRRELGETTTFCNAFWGSNDAGYDVVQGRMKGATKTLEDLRALYRERAEIESDYAKRLAKLAKAPVGRDETGSIRAAMEVIRMELDTTARTHQELGALIRRDLEGAVADFYAKLSQARKSSAAQIEKLYKQKQTQESYVAKSREKYEQDCIKINGYTAQSSLVQGRDLDKVHSKLDKAQATVANNDKDYQNFVKALKDTTYRWNADWKAYLDQCQDLEEERLEFLKGNLWNFANSISSVCVADDESCERVRVSLENCEASRDIVDFIQRYGTGAAIPEPPEYINFARGQPPPPRPSFRTANFQRNTTRPPAQISTAPAPSMAPLPPQPAQPEQQRGRPPPPSNLQSVPPHVGPPSAGAQSQVSPIDPRSVDPRTSSLPQGGPHGGFRPPPGAVGLPGMMGPGGAGSSQGYPGAPGASESATALAPEARQERRMSAKNFLARTNSMNKSPSNYGQDPARPGPGPPQPDTYEPAQPAAPPKDAPKDEDPIAKALAQLRMRSGGRSPAPGSQPSGSGPTSPRKPGAGGGGSGALNADSNPAHLSNMPASGSSMSRPRSPSAAFMQEPERSTSPLPVESVLSTYGQSFPGERKSLSRQNSAASKRSSYMQGGGDRPKSPGPQGFAGVGSRNRSPSPNPQQQHQRLSQQQHASRPSQQSILAPGQVPQRASSPLGIALDKTGSVTHDQMADEYMRRAGSAASQRPPAQQSGNMESYGQPAHLQQQAQTHPARPISAAQQRPPGTQQVPYAPTPSPYDQAQQHAYAAQAAGYAAGPPQSVPVQGHYQPAPGVGPYDSMGSLGRAQGGPAYAAAYGAPQQPPLSATPGPYGQPAQSAPVPSPSQSLPAGVRPPPQPAGGPYVSPYAAAPAAVQHPTYGGPAAPPSQETPASAYLQQYRATHGVDQGSVSSMAPSHVGAAAYAQPAPTGWSQPQQPQPPAPAPQQAPPPQAQQRPAGATNGHGAQGPAPPPTGQYSESGKPILFYVKASYDYAASLEDEFSFQKGDIIAVWETHPDGWWQGELLDDARRRPGANTFPSNFVTLLA